MPEEIPRDSSVPLANGDEETISFAPVLSIGDLADLSMEQIEALRKDEKARKLLAATLFGDKTASKLKAIQSKMRQPYYKEAYALEIKKAVDYILETKKDIVFRYSDFAHMQPNTLKNRIYQSLGYLLDLMDPTGTYAANRKYFEFKIKTYGVAMVYTKLDDTPLIFKPDNIKHTTEEVLECIKQFIERPEDNIKDEWPNSDTLPMGFFLMPEDKNRVMTLCNNHADINIILERENIQIAKSKAFIK